MRTDTSRFLTHGCGKKERTESEPRLIKQRKRADVLIYAAFFIVQIYRHEKWMSSHFDKIIAKIYRAYPSSPPIPAFRVQNATVEHARAAGLRA